MTEIDKFYTSFTNEISVAQLSDEDGASQEQVFTRLCLDALIQANETEHPVLAYDEKGIGTRNQHKLNAYAISASLETLDLFVSIYSPSVSIESMDKLSIDRACTRAQNFFSKCINGNYEKELAETSQVFELAHLLRSSKEIVDSLIRINIFILTNKRYKGEAPKLKEIGNFTMFVNIIDIDKLYSISEMSRLPIHLDLQEYRITPPCLAVPTETEKYNAYLTYLPGSFLADLYKRYGFKLLEQNVRSFLQFRGGINRGIRDTVMKSPSMFFAYNNGISATADSIELDELQSRIIKINNLQIVNGGQTTATLFYVSKDNRANLANVLVPMKISVIKDKVNSYEIIKSISKYANTQNKINDADLSANEPILVEIEKISRYMLTPISVKSNIQHYWFFDRISKQYDNLLALESKTKSRKKAFLCKYPKSCKFTKYELAKYYNSYHELIAGDKVLVGPHCVVDGNEVNFRAFRDYIMPTLNVNQIFFEDLIAIAILFKEVDRRHGTKRSKIAPIGDMKQVMVPYSIALLKLATNGYLDLEKIWRNQAISEELSDYMYNLMVRLNKFLIDKSPRTNIIEWATKEDCWKFVKNEFNIPILSTIQQDLASRETIEERYKSDDSIDAESLEMSKRLIESTSVETWLDISKWGNDSGCISLPDTNIIRNIAHKLKFKYKLNAREILKAMKVYEICCMNNYDIFYRDLNKDSAECPYPLDFITQMVAWDKTPILLKKWQFKILQNSLISKKQSAFRFAELEILYKFLRDNGLVIVNE